MERFVSRRSSSSVDLDPSSLDDVRTERAAIALSVGQTGGGGRADAPPGSSSGNVLFRSTSSTTMSSPMLSAYSGRVGGNQETPSFDRSHTRRSPIPARPVPPQTPRPHQTLKTSPAAALQNATKSRSTPSCATGSSTFWTSGGQKAVGHAAVLVRVPALVPWDVRRDQPEHSLPLETERTSRSTARQEDLAVTRRHDTAERAHPASVRRPVPQRCDDQRPGARVARRGGTRHASPRVVCEEGPARHAKELQEAHQVRERAPQP